MRDRAIQLLNGGLDRRRRVLLVCGGLAGFGVAGIIPGAMPEEIGFAALGLAVVLYLTRRWVF